MFGMFKKTAKEAASKFSGNTDYLEGTCAAAALVAAADGSIEDSEVLATIKAIKSNKILADGFDSITIEKMAEKMLERAGGGRVGRAGLWKEVEEAMARDNEMAQAIVFTALDVSESDGEMEPEEKVVLERLCKAAGMKLSDAMAA